MRLWEEKRMELKRRGLNESQGGGVCGAMRLGADIQDI
jgi:hypothetical protein